MCTSCEALAKMFHASYYSILKNRFLSPAGCIAVCVLQWYSTWHWWCCDYYQQQGEDVQGQGSL